MRHNAYACKRAGMLEGLGYTALAAGLASWAELQGFFAEIFREEPVSRFSGTWQPGQSPG